MTESNLAPMGSSPRDGREVAAQLRRLAIRAHRALRGEPGRGPNLEALRGLRPAIVELEVAVARLKLDRLADYVAALRWRVESAMTPQRDHDHRPAPIPAEKRRRAAGRRKSGRVI